MKDMIKRIREEKGGFTIAELLIVVAIVGVLVAIAIPVFTSQLQSAQHATATANARSAYAEVATGAQACAAADFDADFVIGLFGANAAPGATIVVDTAAGTCTVTGPGAGNETTFNVDPTVFAAPTPPPSS